MRKILFLLVFAVCVPALADELKITNNIKVPKWSDFCDAGYENAVHTDNNDIFNIFGFVKAERLKNNYWADRRESFEKYLNTCNKLPDDTKASCYKELTDVENEKNTVYKSQREHLLYETNMKRNNY